MGARPIASLDSLRFGPLDDPLHQHLLRGVVDGIGGYGNSVGVATVGGETSFHECYRGNILVNAFNLGVVEAVLVREREIDARLDELLHLAPRQ